MKWMKKIISALLVGIILFMSLTVFQGYRMAKTALDNMPIEEKVEQIRSIEHYTTMDELPKMYIDAVLAVEDRRFYSHPGIDLIAIGRALWNDILTFSFAEGGSTITQQLAKNMYFSQKKEVVRKVAEVFVAFELERKYSKTEIFELYVNSIYFGSGYYNVYDASMGYFGLIPSEMNDYESTLLAGIPNAPSAYDPTINPDLASQRQKQVLKKMVRRGYLSQEEADRIFLSQE